jgi:sulfate transport system substrate-binding protein
MTLFRDALASKRTAQSAESARAHGTRREPVKIALSGRVGLVAALALGVLLGLASCDGGDGAVILKNVSYDATRELYTSVNEAFAAQFHARTGRTVEILQSHGGSGKQARAVLDGLDADVVTFGCAADVDVLAQRGRLLPANWSERLPHGGVPFTSTIVFLVRRGNPKGIRRWEDLVRPGVEVIAPNPKTSGGARWIYLAAWGHALRASGGDEAQARAFIAALYRHVPVLDSGARGSATTFARNGIGDVLLAWENEALLFSRRRATRDDFELVVPADSILAEPPVAVVDAYARRHGTETIARDYLAFLFSDAGQQLGATHYFRPQSEAVRARHRATFATLDLFTIDQVADGWAAAQAKHFDEGGVFDQLYQPGRR